MGAGTTADPRLRPPEFLSLLDDLGILYVIQAQVHAQRPDDPPTPHSTRFRRSREWIGASHISRMRARVRGILRPNWYRGGTIPLDKDCRRWLTAANGPVVVSQRDLHETPSTLNRLIAIRKNSIKDTLFYTLATSVDSGIFWN